MIAMNQLTEVRSRFHNCPHLPSQVGHGRVSEYPPHSLQSKETCSSCQLTPHLVYRLTNLVFVCWQANFFWLPFAQQLTRSTSSNAGANPLWKAHFHTQGRNSCQPHLNCLRCPNDHYFNKTKINKNAKWTQHYKIKWFHKSILKFPSIALPIKKN